MKNLTVSHMIVLHKLHSTLHNYIPIIKQKPKIPIIQNGKQDNNITHKNIFTELFSIVIIRMHHKEYFSTESTITKAKRKLLDTVWQCFAGLDSTSQSRQALPQICCSTILIPQGLSGTRGLYHLDSLYHLSN